MDRTSFLEINEKFRTPERRPLSEEKTLSILKDQGYPDNKIEERTTQKKKSFRELKTISTITLSKNGKETRSFPLLNDFELDIEEEFQLKIHEQGNDDDFDTDEEQLDNTVHYCLKQLKQGIEREIEGGGFDDITGNSDDFETAISHPESPNYNEDISTKKNFLSQQIYFN